MKCEVERHGVIQVEGGAVENGETLLVAVSSDPSDLFLGPTIETSVHASSVMVQIYRVLLGSFY